MNFALTLKEYFLLSIRVLTLYQVATNRILT